MIGVDPATYLQLLGLVQNSIIAAAVLGIVADRLRLPVGEWQPFRPSRWHAGPYRARVHIDETSPNS
jgi:hypothetical protein